MKWSEIDIVASQWRVRAARNKANRLHLVPLSFEAIEQLKQITRTNSDFLFPSHNPERPVSGFSKWKKCLDTISGVKAWRIHDLGRTAASGWAEKKRHQAIRNALLRHISIDKIPNILQ
jgi:integrase